MVSRLNKATIGAPLDLAEFLFGCERNQWPGFRPVLRELQEGQCFYCQKSILSGQEELDHFIPWSLYPNDLAHNFVLACRRCNGAKSDDLAEGEALDRWIDRNKAHGIRIENEAASIGLPADANASVRVAAWAYDKGIESPTTPAEAMAPLTFAILCWKCIRPWNRMKMGVATLFVCIELGNLE